MSTGARHSPLPPQATEPPHSKLVLCCVSSATLPTVARWIFLRSEPDTVPPRDSQCPWHPHSSSAWQLATACSVSLAVTIPLLPCFATQNLGQLFKYTILYPPFLSFAHHVLSPWLPLYIPFFSWPSLYILQVCKTQCKMKMWSTLLKSHEEVHNGDSRSSNQAQGPSKSGALCACTDHTAMRSALPSGSLGLFPTPIPGC